MKIVVKELFILFLILFFFFFLLNKAVSKLKLALVGVGVLCFFLGLGKALLST